MRVEILCHWTYKLFKFLVSVAEPKPIGGTTGRPKGKRRGKRRLNDSVWSMTLEDAEQLIDGEE